MRILVDTHVFLWWVLGVDRFSVEAKRVIHDRDNRLLLSVASVWEAGLKLDKLGLADRFEITLNGAMVDLDLTILDVELRHAIHTGLLPFHHRDPFDRMIIAQAIAEGIPILTADKVMAKYGVPIIW